VSTVAREEPFAEAFGAILELADVLGVKHIYKLPGLWCVDVDEHWTIRMNGHREEVGGVPAHTAALEYNGWPAGMSQPSGGIIAAGELANENSFIEAINRRVEKELGARS
jgi:hypothetical protein